MAHYQVIASTYYNYVTAARTWNHKRKIVINKRDASDNAGIQTILSAWQAAAPSSQLTAVVIDSMNVMPSDIERATVTKYTCNVIAQPKAYDVGYTPRTINVTFDYTVGDSINTLFDAAVANAEYLYTITHSNYVMIEMTLTSKEDQ